MIGEIVQHTQVGALALAGAVSDAMVDLIERAKGSVVQVRTAGRGGGTGVVWNANGGIITNHHVVASGRETQVHLPDGREFEAEVVNSTPALDLALLKVEANNLPAAPVGNSSRLRVGELVFAIGHPWGDRWVVTAGIVSGLGTVEVPGSNRTAQYIRSDVRLAPGNSGGPLLNAQGMVIGINAMIFGGDMAAAIPSHMAMTWVAGLPSRRIYLGAGVRVIETGLLIVTVEPGGPGERAGLLADDVLLEIAREPVQDTRKLRRMLARNDGRETVELRVLRGNVIRTLHLEMKPLERSA